MAQRIPKHRDLKQEILVSAKRLFLEEGYGNTSMRKIAADVGISPTTIYLYYEDKAEVMHALHQEGFKLLSAQFNTLQNVIQPFERLKAMGRCYIQFALDNRDFYEIMFIMKEPLEHLMDGKGCSTGWEEGDMALQYLIGTIEDCQKNGYFQQYDSKVLSLLVWSNIHGLCSLSLNGHLELLSGKMGENVPAGEIIRQSFEVYSKMIEKL